MKIGFLTCEERPSLTPSDQVASDYLKNKHSINVAPIVWGRSDQLSDIDLLVVRSTWDYYKKLDSFNRWLLSINIPFLNPLDLVLWNQDKRYLLDLLASGVAIVPSLFASKNEIKQLQERIQLLGWKDLIVKPTVSASAHLTFKVKAYELHNGSILSKVFTQSDVIVQPFLSEVVENGEISAIYFKEKNKEFKYSHAVLKKAADKEFRVQSEFGGSVHYIDLSGEQKKFCENVLSKIPTEWLYARVDFIETKSGPLLGELELIEPDLFFDQNNVNLDLFFKAITGHLE